MKYIKICWMTTAKSGWTRSMMINLGVDGGTRFLTMYGTMSNTINQNYQPLYLYLWDHKTSAASKYGSWELNFSQNKKVDFGHIERWSHRNVRKYTMIIYMRMIFISMRLYLMRLKESSVKPWEIRRKLHSVNCQILTSWWVLIAGVGWARRGFYGIVPGQ